MVSFHQSPNIEGGQRASEPFLAFELFHLISMRCCASLVEDCWLVSTSYPYRRVSRCSNSRFDNRKGISRKKVACAWRQLRSLCLKGSKLR